MTKKVSNRTFHDQNTFVTGAGIGMGDEQHDNEVDQDEQVQDPQTVSDTKLLQE